MIQYVAIGESNDTYIVQYNINQFTEQRLKRIPRYTVHHTSVKRVWT